MAIEHPRIKIDVAAPDGRHQGGATDGSCPCAGVEAKQDEAGDMLRRRPVAWPIPPSLPQPPGRPQEPRRLCPGQPSFACLAALWKHNGCQGSTKPSFPMVSDGCSQILKLAAGCCLRAALPDISITRLAVDTGQCGRAEEIENAP
jgi:hypothetical protein